MNPSSEDLTKGGGLWKCAYNDSLSSQDPPIQMPQPIWQILNGCGITEPDAIEDFFSPQLKSLTHPRSLKDMDLAVERLYTALINQEKVAIYADFDLDGTPGLALLKLGLGKFGFKKIQSHQPKRLTDGYGVHIAAINSFLKKGVKLMITVDVGITDLSSLAYAKASGLDVIVTDHHLPKNKLPEAVAIVNPNQGNCPSNLGHLCGTGVAFYLLMALQIHCKKSDPEWQSVNLKELLDCFAIATITDMVPLVKENRMLVKHGLKVLQKSSLPGLRVLLRELGLEGRSLTSQDIGFKLAPKLNSLSRLEEGPAPIDIFLAKSEQEANSLVGEVLRINERRVLLQRKMENTAEKMVLDKMDRGTSDLTHIWIWSSDFHQGVIGLVASRLSKTHGVPAFVGAVKELADGTKVIVGSARAPQHSSVHLLKMIEENKVLSRFGGHAQALGFELNYDLAHEFEEYLINQSSNAGEEKNPSPALAVYHGKGLLADFDENFMNWYDSMGPYGMGFEAPLFLIENLLIKSAREIRGGHMKFQLSSEKQSSTVDGLWFSPPPNHICVTKRSLAGESVDLLMAPQWNYYSGRKTLQLLISDIKLR